MLEYRQISLVTAYFLPQFYALRFVNDYSKSSWYPYARIYNLQIETAIPLYL